MTHAPSRFTARLIEANGYDPDDFKCWVFCAGMLFGAPDKWWGDFGRRDFPHEGLDFCLFRDAAGNVRRLGERTQIPVMRDGRVRALFNDYLGQAVVIEHHRHAACTEKTLAVYAHTRPRAGILPGIEVREGEIIATIAGTAQAKASILPHLHLSFGRPSADIVYEPFVWNQMRDPDRVTLMNPQGLVDWPFEVLGSECRDVVSTPPGNGARR